MPPELDFRVQERIPGGGERRRGGSRGLPVKRCWMEGDGGKLLKDYSTENGLLKRNISYLEA